MLSMPVFFSCTFPHREVSFTFVSRHDDDDHQSIDRSKSLLSGEVTRGGQDVRTYRYSCDQDPSPRQSRFSYRPPVFLLTNFARVSSLIVLHSCHQSCFNCSRVGSLSWTQQVIASWIYSASTLHAAVNFPQKPSMSFVPSCPSSMFAPPPTDKVSLTGYIA